MSDWVNALTPDERARWDEFVENFRREAIEKIAGSAAFVSLVPSADHVDVKFCVELGAAIMLDKPLVAITLPGAAIPGRLRRVADEIIEVDLDTEEGQHQASQQLAAFLRRRATA